MASHSWLLFPWKGVRMDGLQGGFCHPHATEADTGHPDGGWEAAQAFQDTKTSAQCWLIPLSCCAVGAAGTGHFWDSLGPELGASTPYGLLCPDAPTAHGGCITPMSMRDQLCQFGFSVSW